MQGFTRRLIALTKKELLQLLRDKGSLLLGVVLPLVLILIIGYGMSLDVNHIATAIVLEDSSPTARRVVSFTEGSRYFAPIYVDSMQEAERLMHQHKADIVLRVPVDFTKRLAEKNGEIQLLLNGVETTTAMSVQNYVEMIVLNWAAKEGLAKSPVGQIEVVSRIWYNDSNTSSWFFIPGLIMLILTIIGVFLTAVVMAREWERGTFESLFVTPVRILELILAKIIPYFLVAMLGMFLCLISGRVLYDLPLRGSLWIVLAVSMLYLIVALSIGLVISAATKSQFVSCHMSILISFLPSVMLSGFIFDLHSVPVVIKIVSKLFPTTYYLELLKVLMLSGDYWPLIWKDTAILIGYAILFLTIAFRMTKKKVEG